MNKAMQFIDELIQQQALPLEYKALVEDYLWPLVQDMAMVYNRRTKTELANKNTSPWLVGLQGTQGSGKSTVCLFVKALLEKCFDLNVVILSIDDFYKTHQERVALSKKIHPLLITRGVPGTHDVDLAMETLNKLSNLVDGQFCSVPSFSKILDDRSKENDWPVITNKVDVILFEGWCMGIPHQTNTQLNKPVNKLEKNEDSNALWRLFVNDNLKKDYKGLFVKLDDLIVLQAPNFNCVYQWRLLQETKLTRQVGELESVSKTRIQTPKQIERFISHYERLTRHALNVLPEKASWIIELDDEHNMTSLIRNKNKVRLE